MSFKLAVALIRSGKLSLEEFKNILFKKEKNSILEVEFCRRGLVSPENISKLYAKEYHLEEFSPEIFKNIPTQNAEILSKELSEKYRAIPVRYDEDSSTLLLAVHYPPLSEGEQSELKGELSVSTLRQGLIPFVYFIQLRAYLYGEEIPEEYRELVEKWPLELGGGESEPAPSRSSLDDLLSADAMNFDLDLGLGNDDPLSSIDSLLGGAKKSAGSKKSEEAEKKADSGSASSEVSASDEASSPSEGEGETASSEVGTGGGEGAGGSAVPAASGEEAAGESQSAGKESGEEEVLPHIGLSLIDLEILLSRVRTRDNALRLGLHFLSGMTDLSALFIISKDKAKGRWLYGPQKIREVFPFITINLNSDTIFKSLLESLVPYSGPVPDKKDDQIFFGLFERQPAYVYFFPIRLRHKTVSMLYGHRLETPLSNEQYEQLIRAVNLMGKALENVLLAFKQGIKEEEKEVAEILQALWQGEEDKFEELMQPLREEYEPPEEEFIFEEPEILAPTVLPKAEQKKPEPSVQPEPQPSGESAPPAGDLEETVMYGETVEESVASTYTAGPDGDRGDVEKTAMYGETEEGPALPDTSADAGAKRPHAHTLSPEADAEEDKPIIIPKHGLAFVPDEESGSSDTVESSDELPPKEGAGSSQTYDFLPASDSSELEESPADGDSTAAEDTDESSEPSENSGRGTEDFLPAVDNVENTVGYESPYSEENAEETFFQRSPEELGSKYTEAELESGELGGEVYSKKVDVNVPADAMEKIFSQNTPPPTPKREAELKAIGEIPTPEYSLVEKEPELPPLPEMPDHLKEFFPLPKELEERERAVEKLKKFPRLEVAVALLHNFPSSIEFQDIQPDGSLTFAASQTPDGTIWQLYIDYSSEVVAGLGHYLYSSERKERLLTLMLLQQFPPEDIAVILPYLFNLHLSDDTKIYRLAHKVVKIAENTERYKQLLNWMRHHLFKFPGKPQIRIVRLLGRLRDVDSVYDLINLMENANEPLLKEIHSSLIDITKQPLPPKQKKWIKWWEKYGSTSSRLSWLVEGLSQKDEKIVADSFYELKELTGETFGFSPSASKKERSEAIKKWKAWLKEQS